MDKTYQPDAIETRWYQQWENNGYFSPSGKGAPFSIMIPPPNVTGSLHMGHAFQDTVMDTLVRWRRMQQHNTLWQVGTDHAGIATQMVVERRLAAKGIKRHDLGREKFIDEIWQWKEESGGTITRQLRRMGASVDWSRERFTMDEQLSKAVQEVFVRLYDEGLIYRGKRLVNWDPVLHTAISDLEVENREEQGHMWHFRYPLSDGSGHLVVATTRPETLLGDSAVAVHPDDVRYQALIGKTIRLPLSDRDIPVIADRYVDPEFGTGCVKITPAHDFNDYQVGQRHDLPLINVFTAEATLNDAPEVPEKYRGMDRFVAREAIVADMEAQGLLEKIDKHTLKTPHGDRSGAVIEPWLTDQWFVAVESLAKPAIEAVENGSIQFVPKNYENMYFAWMRDIQDWCISRQLWWGHRIPAWYDKEGNIYVAHNEAEARSKYQLSDNIELHQDNDVLDTWFSSALWTFSTLGWPDKTPELDTFHPTNVLVTGFDIIFFWVARMIMMTLKFTDQVPFKTIYVHGLVRDGQGNKMSKSKGNVLDPLDMIDGISLDDLLAKRTQNLMQPKMAARIDKQTRKEFPDGILPYGTDALRYTFLSLASTGRDIRWDMGRIEGYRNFCNKIWNAARYVLMNTEGQDCGLTGEVELSLADRWITSALQQAEQQVNDALESFRFDMASQAAYEFIWNEYCDWYLELSKPVLYGDSASEAQKRGTRRTLVRVLEAILRLAHPFIPFITEEIWQMIAPLAGTKGESIMLAPYPMADESKRDAAAETDIEWIKALITAIRNIRGEMRIAPSKQINAYIHNGNEDDLKRLNANRDYLCRLARLDDIGWLKADDTIPASATAIAGNMEILVPMAGLIDKEAEIARLTKEIEKIKKESERFETKLANPNFVAKAPADVVAVEKQKLADLKSAKARLAEQLEKIKYL